MYGTVKELRETAQVSEEDFDLQPAENQSEADRLDEILAGFLRTAKEWIDLDRERNFSTEAAPTPEGIKSVSLRLAANMAMDLIERQDAKVVQRDERGQAISFSPKKIFTDDLRWELSLYKKGSQMPSTTWPRMSRARSPEEIAYGGYYDTEFYS